MTDFTVVFDQIQQEILTFLDLEVQDFMEVAIKTVAENWANLIISTLVDKQLKPAISPGTIARRKRRGIGIMGDDVLLIESGSWVEFIEFRVSCKESQYTIEVGVFNESDLIGHTATITPVEIAYINEYGFDELNIPPRNLFTNSNLEIENKIESIISSTWDIIASTQLANGMKITGTNTTYVGHIVVNGADLTFKWED